VIYLYINTALMHNSQSMDLIFTRIKQYTSTLPTLSLFCTLIGYFNYVKITVELETRDDAEDGKF